MAAKNKNLNQCKEIADNIRKQAEALLRSKKIPSIIGEVGQLYFTGSYALDLMTWNDIDMQIVIKDDISPSKAFIKILGAFLYEEGFVEARIINFAGDYKLQMPRGHYLLLKINSPDLGGLWKLDLWILSKKDFERNRAMIEQLKNAMTNQARELILEIKHELMKASGRVPKMGSHWLYQAVLVQGLSEKKAILAFLRDNGVLVD